MSIAEKLSIIAENEKKVYNAGKHEILKAFTNNNTRTNYGSGFQRTDFSGITFNPPIKPISGENLFLNYEGEYLPKGVDLSNSGNTTTTAQFTCRYAAKLKVFPDLNWNVQQRYSGTWQGCTALETIEVIRCDENTEFGAAFSACSSLKNVTFEGLIGKAISFSNSNLLSKESMLHIIEHLKNYSETGTTQTLTLHATAKAKLSESEIAVATQKGWTIA